jgi:type II secretory pathway component PulF
LLAAELGQQTNNLGGALRQALSLRDESEAILRSAVERLLYLVFLVLFFLMMFAFFLFKIVPQSEMILRDSGVEFPAVARWVINGGRFFFNYFPFFLVAGALLLVLVARGFSRHTGYSALYLPVLNASWHRADRGIVLQWLALAVRRNRSLAEMLRLLAAYVMRRGLRLKLERAAKRIDQGTEWTECLRQAGLIRKAEAAVFKSAERAGNLAWALEEMAQTAARRSAYRLRALVSVAFPAALVGLGSLVILAALTLLAPLIKLIQVMS